MVNDPDFNALVQQFLHPQIKAIALLGSFARGDAGTFSDVDLVRFSAANTPNLPDNGSHLINGRLVVVSQVTPQEVKQWFTEPETAVNVIAGVRRGRPLHDPDNYFAHIQQQAHQFIWDDAMQQKANQWASQQMVGWIEEVHKGLEGLQRDDIGRMLNAKHGLTWGMARVLIVQRGILLEGDNAFYEQLLAHMGRQSDWVKWWQAAFGIGPATTLREQIIAGLKVYVETAVFLQDTLTPGDKSLIQQTVAKIKKHQL